MEAYIIKLVKSAVWMAMGILGYVVGSGFRPDMLIFFGMCALGLIILTIQYIRYRNDPYIEMEILTDNNAMAILFVYGLGSILDYTTLEYMFLVAVLIIWLILDFCKRLEEYE